jgi:hypothetical protein
VSRRDHSRAWFVLPDGQVKRGCQAACEALGGITRQALYMRVVGRDEHGRRIVRARRRAATVGASAGLLALILAVALVGSAHAAPAPVRLFATRAYSVWWVEGWPQPVPATMCYGPWPVEVEGGTYEVQCEMIDLWHERLVIHAYGRWRRVLWQGREIERVHGAWLPEVTR